MTTDIYYEGPIVKYYPASQPPIIAPFEIAHATDNDRKEHMIIYCAWQLVPTEKIALVVYESYGKLRLIENNRPGREKWELIF